MKVKRLKEELDDYDDKLDVVIMIGGQLYNIYDIDSTRLFLEITPAGEPIMAGEDEKDND